MAKEKSKPINILEIERQEVPPEVFFNGEPVKSKEEFKKLFEGGFFPPGLEGNIPVDWADEIMQKIRNRRVIQ
ncbi:MAG: hypothetical protein DDT22_01324 [candidate division WS2 bacterium]|nr:hypothetical protein [Candidatus Lithacetigena glycinireducens]